MGMFEQEELNELSFGSQRMKEGKAAFTENSLALKSAKAFFHLEITKYLVC